MEDNKTKGTVYQQLNSLFSNNKFSNNDNDSFSKEVTGINNKKIIIKGNNPNDVVRKGLELQQRKDLENKFFRNTDRSFQKSLQYEAARLPAYIDYEGMEFYPIISSALDLFMEEATTIGYNGKMLNVYSKKDRVKKALEQLFYDVINVNVNLPFWVRNLTKYGDNFILLYGERKKGITHAKQMVNYEIERYDKIKDGKPSVIFKDRMTGDEFNSFEVAHFRLLGDDKFIPYGSCLLSNTYVKTKNGVKEIKDVLVGDIVVGFDINTQKKIEANVLDIVCNGEKNIFKISTNHNYINVTENHKMPYYDYNDKQFKEKLVSDLKIGDGLIINNNDDYNSLVKINKSVNIKENKGRFYDDFTDNLSSIPDYVDEDFAKLFGFLVGDGNVNNKRPYMVYFAYGMHDTINNKYIQLLEKFSNKNIYLRKNKTYGNGIASAVVNSKSLATVLSNMEFIGNSRTKRIPKWVFSTSKEIRKAFLEGIMDADGCVNIDKWKCKRFQIELANYDLINDIKLLAQSLGYKTGSINQRKPRKNIIINGNKVINISDSFVLYFYESINTQLISSDIENRKTNEFIIEKIKSIEPNEKGFVYDIYVDNENHNFYANNIVVHNSVLNKVRRVFRMLVMAEDAMLTYRIIRAGEKKVFKIDIGNIDEDDVEEYIHKVATKFKRVGQVAPNDGQIDYRFNILGNDEDYFLPVRNANTLTGIDTLPGACLSLDTKINLLDGRLLKLIDIIDEFNQGKSLWTYSINPTNGDIVSSPITWAGVTRKNTGVLKITLDNGESLTCTPDHKIPTKHNGVKEAKDLLINESLWSFNNKFKTRNTQDNKFEMIYDHNTNTWEYNHKVISIEYLDTKIDTGTITVDGNEQYHNYHNFPIESGIFVNNSNLNDIHDIEYLRDNLFIGLGIPKPFLSFQDAAGAGKNMAQYDIRFAKKVVRIQQAAIQELNKMAIIHLFLLGFSNEDLNDFELTLTNPSIQQELLKSELLREKAQTYTELTRGENGIAAMSHTEAKRVVFNMSDSQIVEDLKQQKMEKVVMQELADAPVLIKKSGLFADIDKKFGQETALIGEPSGGTENGGIPPMGNDMGGGMPPMGNDMGGQPNAPAGGMPPGGPMGGNMNTQVPPMNEDISRYMNNVNRLVYGDNYQLENVNEKSTQDMILESMVENNKLNDNAKNMITEIDDLLNNDINEFDGIDLENIN